MAEEQKSGGFALPSSTQDYAALGISLLAVFVLVQFGAPLIRSLEFLDQKFRDFFISGAFVAFPFIHRAAKQSISGFIAGPPPRPELSPWFVSGAFVAALVFAWNQIVGFFGGMALGTFVQMVGLPKDVAPEVLGDAQLTSLLLLTLPLTAMASVYAGMLLYRHTRSHVLLALVFAVVLFIVFNVLVNSVVVPELMQQQWARAVALGPSGVAQFFLGAAFVAFIVFAFAGIGVLISRVRSESSMGKVMVAARRLKPAEREQIANEILARVEAAAGARGG